MNLEGVAGRMLVVGAFLLVFAGIFQGAGWFSSRGAKVVDATCAWNPEANAYVAQGIVQNKEDAYKLVEVNIRYSLKPKPGQKWPHSSIRRMYETVNHQTVVDVESKSAASLEDMLGAEVPDFGCKVVANVSRQARFKERPDAGTLNAVRSQMGSSRGGGMTGPSRRRGDLNGV